MQNFEPFVSIVIPSFNSASMLKHAVEACLEQDYPRDKFEIIVVDDGSTDNTKDVIRDFDVRYIYQKNQGPASARNIGWKSAKGELIFFTDADCIPLKNCLTAMVKSLYTNGADAVSGTYAIKNENNILARCIHAEIAFRHSRMPEYINSFGAYNLLMKKNILEEFSGFDEEYPTSSAEDSELSYRMIKKGYKIYFEKESIVLHFHERKLHKYLKKQFQRSFWAIRLWRHHPGFAMSDYYLHWKDLLELLLGIMVIMALPFLFAGSSWIFAGTLFAYTAIETVIPLKIYAKKCYGKDFFFMVFVMFMRGFIRILGGGISLVKRKT